eukprot:3901332-Amphidinium_carterae.1
MAQPITCPVLNSRKIEAREPCSLVGFVHHLGNQARTSFKVKPFSTSHVFVEQNNPVPHVKQTYEDVSKTYQARKQRKQPRSDLVTALLSLITYVRHLNFPECERSSIHTAA